MDNLSFRFYNTSSVYDRDVYAIILKSMKHISNSIKPDNLFVLVDGNLNNNFNKR